MPEATNSCMLNFKELSPFREVCCEPESSISQDLECFPLSSENDPIFERDCIPFLRSSPAPGRTDAPRRYLSCLWYKERKAKVHQLEKHILITNRVVLL